MATVIVPRISNDIPKHNARFYRPIKRTVLELGEVFDRLGDVIQLTGFPVRIFCFRHPEHVKQILKHPDIGDQKFPKILPRVKWTMRSGGYILKGGQEWKDRRVQVQTAFRRDRLVEYANQVPALVQEMLNSWDSQSADGVAFDVFRELRRLITRCSFRMFFSRDLSGDELDRISDETYFIDPNFLRLSPLWFPLPGNLRFRRSVNHIRETICGLLQERANSHDHPNDLIQTLFQMRGGDSKAWSEDEMINEIFSIYFGASVMSTSLAWCLYLVAEHPDIQAKLKQEAEGILPTSINQSDLPYTNQVLQETLRLFPPSWGYPRYCDRDVEIDGYKIPGASMVIPMVYHTHRHPEFWDEPERFNPERFAIEAAEDRHPFAHVPFGAGPRICLGAQLAPMVMAPIVEMIFHQYRLEFQRQSPTDPVADFGFEIHPRDEIRIVAQAH